MIMTLPDLVRNIFSQGFIWYHTMGENNQTEETVVESPNVEEASYVKLFFFGTLALGLCLQAILQSQRIKRRIFVPYTCALLILGLVVGLIVQIVTGTEERAQNIFERFTLVNANPNLIMSIFLPILIFDSAFKMEAHAVVKAFWQIMILAIVALLITAVLIAASMFAFVTYGQHLDSWTFPVCLVFGSILSATDPVAVVSLLRELGAPKAVAIITEGESLLNDGAAIIAYDIFLKLAAASLHVHEANRSLGSEIARILVGIFLSPLVGLVGGLICEWLSKKTFNNEIRSKGIIVILVYTTYFFAEEVDVSGVLAIVVMGLWMSYKRHSISPDAMDDNNRFWEFFSYWANTIIFILAGLEISRPFFETGKTLNYHLLDFAYVFIVYVVINIARGISILILYPILSRIGYGLTFKHALVLVWGGLRGAIALLLSLQLLREPTMVKHTIDIGEKVLLYVAGSVALTLLINATTFRAMVHHLNMDMLPTPKRKVLLNSFNYLKDVRREIIRQLKDDSFLAEADWDTVAQLTSLESSITSPLANEDELEEEKESAEDHINRRVLQVQRVSYLRQYAKGLLSVEAIQMLSSAVEEKLEAKGAPLTIEALRQDWEISRFHRFLQQLLHRVHTFIRTREIRVALRKPPIGWRRKMHKFAYNPLLEMSIYALVVAHATVVIMWHRGSLKQLSQEVMCFKLSVYAIFITDTVVKLITDKYRRFFSSLRNRVDTIFALLYAVNLGLLLSVRGNMGLFEYIFEALLLFRVLNISFAILGFLPHFAQFLDHLIHSRFTGVYEAIKGYMVGEEDVGRNIGTIATDRPRAKLISNRARDNHLEALKHLYKIRMNQPCVAVSVKTKQAARYCLNALLDKANDLNESGLIDTEEFEIVETAIKEKIYDCRHSMPCLHAPSLEQILRNITWIDYNEKIVNYFMKHSTMKQFPEGKHIYSQGDAASGLYILVTGMAKLQTEEEGEVVYEEYLYAGRFFGEISVLTGENQLFTASTESPVVTYHLPMSKAVNLLDNHIDVYASLAHSVCLKRACEALGNHPTFADFTDAKLKSHAAMGQFIDLRHTSGYQRSLKGEFVVLIRGSVYDPHKQKRFAAKVYKPLLIPNDCHILTPTKPHGKDPVWIFVVPPVNYEFPSSNVLDTQHDPVYQHHQIPADFLLFSDNHKYASDNDNDSNTNRKISFASMHTPAPFLRSESVPSISHHSFFGVLPRSDSVRTAAQTVDFRIISEESSSTPTSPSVNSIATWIHHNHSRRDSRVSDLRRPL